MEELAWPPPGRGPRRPGRAAGLVAAGLVAGVALAGLGIANAQSSGPTPAPSESAAPAPDQPRRGPGKGFGPGRGHRSGHLPGALHGEWTVPDGNGGFRTLAMQRGEVTAVGATSVTVRSEDGFSRTYAVNDDTLVNAGNEGIADVKTGDDVRVTAVVSGGTARAVEVVDATEVDRIRGRWQPRRPAPEPSATG